MSTKYLKDTCQNGMDDLNQVPMQVWIYKLNSDADQNTGVHAPIHIWAQGNHEPDLEATCFHPHAELIILHDTTMEKELQK